jgi:hypothetical protein
VNKQNLKEICKTYTGGFVYEYFDQNNSVSLLFVPFPRKNEEDINEKTRGTRQKDKKRR